MVEAARVSTVSSAHQFRTGTAQPASPHDAVHLAGFGVSRTKLWMRLMLPSASPARLASSLRWSSTCG